MDFSKTKKIAEGRNIVTDNMSKVEIVRAIQNDENNLPCYATDRILTCREFKCLWRDDCKLEYKKIVKQS